MSQGGESETDSEEMLGLWHDGWQVPEVKPTECRSWNDLANTQAVPNTLFSASGERRVDRSSQMPFLAQL